jgi:hypothetical protein
MNKTISINPELFTLTNTKKKSRKKNISDTDNKIKIKPGHTEKQKRKQIRKQHILKFLRQQQEKNYQKLLQSENSQVKKNTIKQDDSFNNDFDSSLKYLKSLSENKNHGNNYTVKTNYNKVNRPTSTLNGLEPIIHNNSFDESHNNETIELKPPQMSRVPEPRWGCMKNGSLPTFKEWKRSTQKIQPDENKPLFTNEPLPIKTNEIISLMKAKKETIQPKVRTLKQKRTIRRNYKVGKSKIFSKVSVLVSNKTIRNNIMSKTQEFKTIPIDVVRRFLIKRGFIRVGSSAPNDVLRKMYETANLVCGEIENHNSENLLYNFLNDQ